ncbi:MAG: hypothetical protein JO001_26410 [Alphaproteobacteria bacterium]|nr:hypothetical protein [Alphaproteobacteria bacterium]
MIEIDLRATFISPQKRVWRLFPGSAYRFLDAFKEGNIAFLDLPRLEFPDFPLTADRELMRRVLMSEEIANQLQELGPDHTPTVDVADYQDARMGAAQREAG